MNGATTTNRLPEKQKEQLHQKVMEMGSQSTVFLKKLKKSWEPGIRLTLSDQFSADATDSERCCKSERSERNESKKNSLSNRCKRLRQADSGD